MKTEKIVLFPLSFLSSTLVLFSDKVNSGAGTDIVPK